MVEYEITYLAKYVPEHVKECASEKMFDIYIENDVDHPDLRLRQKGEQYEITRKRPVSDSDASVQTEITIPIDRTEFESMRGSLGRRIEKTRYMMSHEDVVAEFDIFEGELAGLVVVDFEFENEEAKVVFSMPEFCLVDVTQEDFIAGGALAGKTYADIEHELERFEYIKIENV